MVAAPLILSALGAGLSTLLLGYLAYKLHKRFGKLDRNLGHAVRTLERVREKVDNLRQDLKKEIVQLNRRQATLLDRVAKLEDSLRKQTHAVSELSVAVADAQLETGYLNSLNSLPIRFPLFFGRWSIDGVTAKCIVDTIKENRPNVVLELGSGSSTVLIAATLEALGMQATRHIAVDHLEKFLEISRENLAIQGLSRKAEFWYCPLAPTTKEGDPHWYSGLLERLGNTKIDLLIVDGPPGKAHPEARRPAMDVLEPHLSQDAVVIMDDASRPEEARILELWKERFPDLEIELSSHGKGCARVRRGLAPR